MSRNLENLFDRARAMTLDTWDEGRAVLNTYARVNRLFKKAQDSAADTQAILEGLKTLTLLKQDDGGPFARLRQNRSRLLRRPKRRRRWLVAEDGRGDPGEDRDRAARRTPSCPATYMALLAAERPLAKSGHAPEDIGASSSAPARAPR